MEGQAWRGRGFAGLWGTSSRGVRLNDIRAAHITQLWLNDRCRLLPCLNHGLTSQPASLAWVTLAALSLLLNQCHAPARCFFPNALLGE
ncbi:hypothetical protein E2C01_057439 [Portunus trituberculatus]|uniref:Uncharacterized protein n=1 Tax=Portunus trituberculatus TaxID=210409 RepID=A0A5B7GSW0_PORTR|nr:hypothetical protein [Portunus trituberculatus]